MSEQIYTTSVIREKSFSALHYISLCLHEDFAVTLCLCCARCVIWFRSLETPYVCTKYGTYNFNIWFAEFKFGFFLFFWAKYSVFHIIIA